MRPLLEKYFSIIHNFLPEKETQPSIGLDIGSDSCKAVELLPKENVYEVQNWIIASVKEGETEALKKIFEKIKVDQKNLYTAISGQGTLIRYIQMPRMPQEDLKKSFILEADKYFPFPKEMIYTDCCILDSKDKGPKMSVFVAAAKKEIVDQKIQILSSLGVPVHFVGLTTVALMNAFTSLSDRKGLPRLEDNKAVALLDMGATTSSLSIMRGDSPRFSRYISLGGRELTKRIVNVLGMSMEEAERIKCDPHTELENVLNACESVLLNLISEIRLSFDYFVTENNIPVDKLFLTGGSSLMKNIEKFFKTHLEIPVQVWNPIEALQCSPGASAEDFGSNINKLCVALGLALHQDD